MGRVHIDKQEISKIQVSNFIEGGETTNAITHSVEDMGYVISDYINHLGRKIINPSGGYPPDIHRMRSDLWPICVERCFQPMR